MRTYAMALLCLPLAGAQLSLNSITLSPGSSGIIPISFNTQGQRISALQFDVGYDSSTFALNMTAGTAVRSAAKDTYASDPSAAQHRVLLAGLNQALLQDGAVLTLVVNVASNAAAGTYTITTTNGMGVDPDGNAIPLGAASGIVTIAGQVGDVSPIQSSGILNAATLLSGAVSPGSMVALMGSGIGPATPQNAQFASPDTLSTVLANTQVKFDGTPAPLLYAASNQINAIVPYEVAGPTTSVTIVKNGQATPAIALPVVALTPGIFTQHASGTGQAAVLNQDGSLNTPLNPAALGSYITLYLGGAGQMNPVQITGHVNGSSDIGKTQQPVTATIEGLAAEVLYAGPAPSLVAGATQVNLRLPPGATPSMAAPVVIQVGNATTQDDVVVSVGP